MAPVALARSSAVTRISTSTVPERRGKYGEVSRPARSTRIEDYALIGDTHTAALVSKQGSIDWMCVPRFDSSACFAALLGDRSHGRWKIAPKHKVKKVTRRYRDRTLVLETEMETATGKVRLTDCMPTREGNPVVVRRVEGLSGTVPVHMDLVIRFDYGSTVPWVSDNDGLLTATAGPDALSLWSSVETRGEDMATVADFDVSAGEAKSFVLAWYPSHAMPPRPLAPEWAIGDTERFWRAWSDRCTYEGDYGDAVLRSLITLKALTYAPTGGIVAAPTLGLPETLGGARNWDYRYCWLRDATLTLMSLMGGGYHEEAAAWRDWLLRAVAGDVSRIQIMYGPGGERRLEEYEIDWLPGYDGSRPVRVGNAAAGQFQLDVYGEVMDALYQAHCDMDGRDPKHGQDPAWGLQIELMDFLETGWKRPDDGIWEVRGPQRQFTHSKVMAWVAVDRAISAVDQLGLPGPVDKWRKIRQAIHEEVCENGWNPKVGAFTQYYGSDDLDASVLMIPMVGFLPPTDERVTATVEAIKRELMHDGFVLRYRTHDDPNSAVDGLSGREGAFLACSFWMVDNLALMGRQDEARELFERLLGLANDVGLLAEEYDPVVKRQVGNFPQAFSHVGLVHAARSLASEGETSMRRAQVRRRQVRPLPRPRSDAASEREG